MSRRTIFGGSPVVTSLQESECGITRSGSPVGRSTDPSGQVLVPANLSARQALVMGLTTSGTFGPRGIGSFRNADLNEFTESRLRALSDCLGSTLFGLTFKERASPGGEAIFALRASGRRTSDSASSSWPTPQAHDSAGRSRTQKEKHGTKHGCACLARSADLASWPTPNCSDATRGSPETDADKLARGANTGKSMIDAASLASWPTPKASDGSGGRTTKTEGGGNSHLDVDVRLASWNTPRATDGSNGGPNQANGALSSDAALSSWVSPSARDGKDTSGMSLTGTNPDGSTRSRVDQLPRQVQLCGPARRTASGETLIGSSARMESGGQLSPAHSRWLMGLPSVWDQAAPTKADLASRCSKATGTQSSGRSRRRSSISRSERRRIM